MSAEMENGNGEIVVESQKSVEEVTEGSVDTVSDGVEGGIEKSGDSVEGGIEKSGDSVEGGIEKSRDSVEGGVEKSGDNVEEMKEDGMNGVGDDARENGVGDDAGEVAADVVENGALESPVVCPEEVCEKIETPQPPQQNGPKKVAMCTSMDTETVRAAYDDVRADNTETQWAVFKFEGSRIVCSSKGISFDEFKGQFMEDERAFGYIRVQTGDELSKRQKFLFVTWVGPGVSVIQRAKMSTDKSIIKNVLCNFAVELQMESHAELDLQFFIESLNKASGANYGTGVREN